MWTHARVAPDQGGNAVQPSDQPGLVRNRTKPQVQPSVRATPPARPRVESNQSADWHTRSGKCDGPQAGNTHAPPGARCGARQPLAWHWNATIPMGRTRSCTARGSTACCAGRTPQVRPCSEDWQRRRFHASRDHVADLERRHCAG